MSPAAVEAGGLQGVGVPDMPIREVVLKIHSRCDLACDHCYVYEHADQSWRRRPPVISLETLGQVARRLAEYAAERKLTSVAVILHGGEPLLVGPARLRHICAELKRALAPVTDLDLRIHTNGVRLDRAHLDVLKEFHVRVGLSLDGDRAANDRHRRDRKGRSSYERVMRGLELLRQPDYRHLYQGLLCTVDVANDPVAVHDALTALSPPRLDYLLPHATWEAPPPGRPGTATPYADWLLAVFDRWEEQGRPMPVRVFTSVLSTLRGGPSHTEAMGLAPADLAVIETDGTFEQADSLKTAFDGAPETGYDVHRHDFAEFARHPGVLARQAGIAGVSETCRRCPVVESCGGGLYAHRYSAGRGFDNPSVHCADLRSFIEGVAERITDRALAPAVTAADELGLAQLELDHSLLTDLSPHLVGSPGWEEVWQLLVRLASDTTTAPHLDRVLTHPYLRPLLRSRQGPVDLPHLMAAAVAAAVRAQAETTLAWDHSGLFVHLPTLGTVRLSRPGHVEFRVSADGFRVHHMPSGQDEGSAVEDATEWRPLESLSLTSGPPLLLDDADPYRDCYPSPVTPPLGSSDVNAFRERLRTAYTLLDARTPDWRQDINAPVTTTITPLGAGAGLRLGAGGMRALGVAVDFDPEEFVRELPRLGRRARLTALRQVADLNVPGNRAGQLLDLVSDSLGRAVPFSSRATEAWRRAGHALGELAALPDSELTESGIYLADELRTEWTALHD
ncbi:radical SAM/SPASM protein FxsBH, inactivated beta-hydroxylase extension form [Streptomyces europaeiscabiei]|uniref:radical SAM/SPASM protein FxsBH, inactivated beta-hydroxylase extension form n=1 Tax=Streptomyces europaeiscabiei TaxID=146819 RepID=UPI0029ACBAFD|nr:radical SAM/SPASM protein FxsB, inactivated metallohydrolase extension form [Streptomyces europaeiscabiei]MDX3840583.1 radical SAM/SPASM protein FxsB, inactivated metallohydrolase extension form [Streptomyces europaeiscabiei]